MSLIESHFYALMSLNDLTALITGIVEFKFADTELKSLLSVGHFWKAIGLDSPTHR